MHDHAEFKIPYAGGCEIGKRSVLPHIYMLEEFGTNLSPGCSEPGNRIRAASAEPAQ